MKIINVVNYPCNYSSTCQKHHTIRMEIEDGSKARSVKSSSSSSLLQGPHKCSIVTTAQLATAI